MIEERMVLQQQGISSANDLKELFGEIWVQLAVSRNEQIVGTRQQSKPCGDEMTDIHERPVPRLQMSRLLETPMLRWSSGMQTPYVEVRWRMITCIEVLNIPSRTRLWC